MSGPDQEATRSTSPVTAVAVSGVIALFFFPQAGAVILVIAAGLAWKVRAPAPARWGVSLVAVFLALSFVLGSGGASGGGAVVNQPGQGTAPTPAATP